jgi:hypothetical protein
MEITVSKIASLIVAIGYLFAAFLAGGGERSLPARYTVGPIGTTIILGLALLFPLSLIWLPDFWGEQTGRFARGTPSWVVALGGWFLLIGLPIILFFVLR